MRTPFLSSATVTSVGSETIGPVLAQRSCPRALRPPPCRASAHLDDVDCPEPRQPESAMRHSCHTRPSPPVNSPTLPLLVIDRRSRGTYRLLHAVARRPWKARGLVLTGRVPERGKEKAPVPLAIGRIERRVQQMRRS